jgi:acyl carrier protein
VRDPWGAPGVRAYLTGDLGRRRPDGSVEFLGRVDRQLSVNGQRLEPAEIEHVARSHPDVSDCALVPDAAGASPRLLVVPRVPGRGGLPAEVIAHLAQSLPASLMPSTVHVVPAIPLTPNGKVDNEALARLATLARDVQIPGQRAPRETVAMVLAAWSSVLGSDDMSEDTNFFDAGGTSVQLLQLRQLLETDLSRPVSLLDLFRYPTVRRFAASLETPSVATTGDRATARRAMGARERRLEIRRAARRGEAELTDSA